MFGLTIKINRHDSHATVLSVPSCFVSQNDWFENRSIRILLFHRYRNRLATFLMIIVFGRECRIFPRKSIMKLG